MPAVNHPADTFGCTPDRFIRAARKFKRFVVKRGAGLWNTEPGTLMCSPYRGGGSPRTTIWIY
jgi:hypothetical protein